MQTAMGNPKVSNSGPWRKTEHPFWQTRFLDQQGMLLGKCRGDIREQCFALPQDFMFHGIQNLHGIDGHVMGEEQLNMTCQSCCNPGRFHWSSHLASCTQVQPLVLTPCKIERDAIEHAHFLDMKMAPSTWSFSGGGQLHQL